MKHTTESKQKLRIARINYLKNNPTKKSWQNKGHYSIPCETFKKLLTDNNIKFVSEYQPVLHLNRFFCIDISFPNLKIGIEINGGQHYDTNGKLKEYYQKRHNLIESDGWTLYEIPYYRAFDAKFMFDVVNNILKSPIKLNFDYETYIPRPKKINKPRNPKMYTNGKFNHLTSCKYTYPSDTELKELALNFRLKDLSLHLKIPIKSLWYHLNNRNIICKKEPLKCKYIPPDNWLHLPQPSTRKVIRPSKEILEKEILEFPMTTLGKKYGVRDNSIRKWCKYYDIKLPYRRGYWAIKYKIKMVAPAVVATAL